MPELILIFGIVSPLFYFLKIFFAFSHNLKHNVKLIVTIIMVELIRIIGSSRERLIISALKAYQLLIASLSRR